jgi:hypothetical protein
MWLSASRLQIRGQMLYLSDGCVHRELDREAKTGAGAWQQVWSVRKIRTVHKCNFGMPSAYHVVERDNLHSGVAHQDKETRQQARIMLLLGSCWLETCVVSAGIQSLGEAVQARTRACVTIYTVSL